VTPETLVLKDRQPLDSRMIVHPPPSSLGVQPRGTQLAQNLYPGLELLPIDISKAKLQPIPIIWPDLKVEPIPIHAPKVEVKTLESGTGK
jgi:hypothetical protein